MLSHLSLSLSLSLSLTNELLTPAYAVFTLRENHRGSSPSQLLLPCAATPPRPQRPRKWYTHAGWCSLYIHTPPSIEFRGSRHYPVLALFTLQHEWRSRRGHSFVVLSLALSRTRKVGSLLPSPPSRVNWLSKLLARCI